MDPLNNPDRCLVRRPARTEEKRGRTGRNAQRTLQPLGRGEGPKRCKDGVNRRGRSGSAHAEMLVEETGGGLLPRDQIIQKTRLWLVVTWPLRLKGISEEKKRQINTSQRWRHIVLCLLFVSICPEPASSQVRVDSRAKEEYINSSTRLFMVERAHTCKKQHYHSVCVTL